MQTAVAQPYQPLIKLGFALAIGFLASAACAQQAQYPAVKPKAQQVGGFVPPGWEIRDGATGDLNKDGLADEALVLERSARKGKPDSVLPRMLVVLFKLPANQGYTLSAQSNSFILTHDDPETDEPLAGISITRGVLKIDFQYNRSDSHDDLSTSAYKFRYNGRQFVLIGADISITGRMSFTFQKYSYNFLTRKGVFTTGPLGEDADPTLTRTLALPVPKTLDTFVKPGTWLLDENFFL
ncbi:hypothetical protein MON38_00965 [Hymenobacter sp. DH14]|uniref:Uncharacterized protein n=1 Tax=Hymenobacter cyanobacteriorum TaxID=2926463 RepID=A0A9X1VD57_9BACT|nr:hypothetical protein [Hymenobacter cyanobacteriorum]MCI1185972.1 hypothetical protein [Hymenobacter cyanobacteriorum]